MRRRRQGGSSGSSTTAAAAAAQYDDGDEVGGAPAARPPLLLRYGADNEVGGGSSGATTRRRTRMSSSRRGDDNVARQLANAALFNKLHRFLVHRYVRLLGLSKDEIADFYAEGVAEASTIRSTRQVTPFERDPILFNSNHKCRDIFLTDLLRLLE
ncbi:hypothetical protein BDZ97DRAFT_2083074 [Flammula alnicola]|nr:hypothetical protein BDZ97DRAFT_2083074 [Flammula alnicola]